MIGYSIEFDEWLNTRLIKEDHLSSIVLDLALCGSDIEKVISILRQYRKEEPVDEASVRNRMRLFLKNAYHSKQYNKGQVTTAMSAIASYVGAPGNFDTEVWGSMFSIDEYYSLAEEGIITWEEFDPVFFDYLDNGIPCDFNKIWDSNKKPSLSERIKQFFKKNDQFLVKLTTTCNTI